MNDNSFITKKTQNQSQGVRHMIQFPPKRLTVLFQSFWSAENDQAAIRDLCKTPQTGSLLYSSSEKYATGSGLASFMAFFRYNLILVIRSIAIRFAQSEHTSFLFFEWLYPLPQLISTGNNQPN